MNFAWWQDVRFAVRTLSKTPFFTGIAILTLALGIGANTSIFTVVNQLLLSPLPYSNPARLVLVALTPAGQPSQTGVFSLLRYQQIRDQNHTFSATAAFTNETFNLTGAGDAEQLRSARVTWNFFDVLGVRPALGRTFTEDEDQTGAKQVVLISHSLWLRRFGAERDIVGRNITLDSRSYTVIGVLSPGFLFPFLGTNVDVWAPRVGELNLATPQQVAAGAGFLTGVARLRDGASVKQAQADMDVLNRQYERDNPGRPDAAPNQVIDAGELQSRLVANIKPALLILLGAVGFVLLIACANVASLLLSRALLRRKEIAIRAALGANRTALLRQLLTESLVLAAVSGIAGVLLSQWGTHVLSTLAGTTLPRLANVHMDLRVLAFTALVAIASGVLFGLAPALQLSNADLNAVLRDESRGSTGSRSRNSARNFLVVAQVALSMVLLIGSGLLIRSFLRLQTASTGVDSSNVLTLRLNLPTAKYGKPADVNAFYNEALRQLGAIPGVQGITITSALPLNPVRFSPALPEGQPALPLGQLPLFAIETISPDYTKVMHVPLLRGREFTPYDNAPRPESVIVNQAAVKRFWPNDNPIGKHIRLGRLPNPVEVVGVLGDVKNVGLASEAIPEILLPFPELPWPLLYISVRTAQDPHTLISAVRHQIWQIDRDQPITNVQTMDELIAAASAQPRFTTVLLGIFASTALVLAIVGIYGVIAYSVAQRTQELGIRLALGAGRADILGMVMRHGLTLTGAGIVIGIGASLALTRLMSTLLYHTSTTDVFTFALSAAVFAAVGLLASYVPAFRATRIDPTNALKYE